MKLELEVTLTPETEVTSTVTSNNSSNFGDSDQSNEDTKANINTGCIPTVIPPTTIVCLPSLVSVPNSMSQQQTITNVQSNFSASNSTNQTNTTSQPPPTVQKTLQPQQQQQNVFTNCIQRPNVTLSQPQQQQRTAVVASSSSLPYLSLATTQPLRAVPNSVSLIRQKAPVKGGRGSRANSNRPPPGAVNLERSYQICQAVIQNSPNRHQLKAQLRPPPSMIHSTSSTPPNTTTIIKKEENLSTSNKVICISFEIYPILFLQLFLNSSFSEK